MDDTQNKIDALLDAFEQGKEGLQLIILSLEDTDREVRQSALLLLAESEEELAKQALYNHLPFSKIVCLHTITKFGIDKSYDPDFLLIVNHNNTLIVYWLLDYFPFCKTWNLPTGNNKKQAYIGSGETSIFGLGKEEKLILINDQHHIWTINTDSLEETDKYHECDICQRDYIDPLRNQFAICPTDKTLIAIGSSHHCYKEIEIKNYQTYNSYIKYKIEEGLYLNPPYHSRSDSPASEKWLDQLSTMIFSPDGRILVINFYYKNKDCNLLHIWDIPKKELIQTIDNLPKLAITSLGINPEGKVIACGVRENKICVWDLQNDKTIYTINEFAPCIITSDGRVLIYATDNYDIVIWDLINNQTLNILLGHTAPIMYLAMSSDKEFIASYSCDKKIKIWGIV